jgi:hypothetical protein
MRLTPYIKCFGSGSESGSALDLDPKGGKSAQKRRKIKSEDQKKKSKISSLYAVQVSAKNLV